jgi:hypothetical protein
MGKRCVTGSGASVIKREIAMKKLMFAALALSAAFATPASALTIIGTTVGGPTYNRPQIGTPPTVLSAVGTAVSYQLTPFTVSVTGNYSFLMTGLTPVNWDTFLGLNSISFNPGTPLVNALVYNDDFPSIGLSGFSRTLTAGVSYFAIATGFANTDAGRYSLVIDGPGVVTVGGAIPEVSTWAMIVAGFGVMGAALRRRRRAGVAFA